MSKEESSVDQSYVQSKRCLGGNNATDSEERTTVGVHKTDNSQSIREAISSPGRKQTKDRIMI